MTLSMYQASVPVFTTRLQAMAKLLTKSEAYAVERKIDPLVLVNARLAPDMHPLIRQIQFATDHAKGAPSRLAGQVPPKFEDNETTFADLQARIAKTIAHLETFSAADIDGSDDRIIEMKVGQRELKFPGTVYLLAFAMPNFYFHITTAYNILRHNGVPLGKMDFMGV